MPDIVTTTVSTDLLLANIDQKLGSILSALNGADNPGSLLNTLNNSNAKLDLLSSGINGADNTGSITALLNHLSTRLDALIIPAPQDNTSLEKLLTDILGKLTFLETAVLWIIGLGTASIVLYIIYRCIANFLEF